MRLRDTRPRAAGFVQSFKAAGVAVLLATGGAAAAACDRKACSTLPGANAPVLGLPCPVPAAPFFRAPAPIEFGVELEVNGLDVYDAERLLAPMTNITAVPDTWGTWLGFTNVAQKGRDVGAWRAVTDESLSGSKSVEVVSPPMRYENISLLTDVAQTLARHGARVDALAALHVHVNHTSLSAGNVADLVHLFDRHGALLLRLSGTSPRQYLHWAKLFEPALSDRLQRRPPRSKSDVLRAHRGTYRTPAFEYRLDSQRYYVLGLNYLAEGSTVEYRQLGPTVSADSLRARVDLALALTHVARDGGLGCLLSTPFDPGEPADVGRFLDALGVTEGHETARSRALLLQDAAHPVAFAFAEGELQRGVVHGVLGAVAAIAAARPASGLPAQAVTRAARAYSQTALLYSASLTLEALGVTGYEMTHIARKFTFARLLLVGESGRLLFEGVAFAVRVGTRTAGA